MTQITRTTQNVKPELGLWWQEGVVVARNKTRTLSLCELFRFPMLCGPQAMGKEPSTCR
jgi:hypothetical protein